MCDLIVCCAIPKNEKESLKLDTTLHSIEYLKFNNKYILFDGAPDKASVEQIEFYTSLKEVFVKKSHDFKVIEYKTNLYYKSMLEKFIGDNFDELNDNLFIIQDDVQLGKIDLDTVLKDKEENTDCKILYFGENRPKAAHWFQVISQDARFVKTHGWSERVYIITKKDLKNIFDFLKTFTRGGKNGKFIDVYYQNTMSRKSWKLMDTISKLDYWAIWGCFEYKGVFHRHLVMKR